MLLKLYDFDFVNLNDEFQISLYIYFAINIVVRRGNSCTT
jgi:hypothetical protein